ncbi:Nicotinamidase-related amidase [Rhizobium sp. RU35A]|uniref:Isochorismatase family protein n=1 Tax=Rhizobium straminoryzae TaxID=1387186 RepID=A0A549T8U7_9HYPH|nr:MULTISPECIES: isochorismatase family protein [Rhizobium]TRL38286.1 isochorismatase family protein [Rhizobium straminoryzae]SIR05051.1 Nicotinamidase-related amidase [Rhizobium sp. RU35A]
MSDTALVVIDVQESFRHRPYWDTADLPRYLERQQALIDAATARGLPVIQVFHVEESGPFSKESGHVRTLEGLRIAPTRIVEKRRHSALVGSGLDVWLVQNGIRNLIISGIRTEQCCETTTRHASDLGFKVTYVAEATLTFPMTDAEGVTHTPADIRRHTAMVLKDRFARIASVEDALGADRLAA